MSDELIGILDRIAKGQHTDADIVSLCQILGWSDRKTKQQLGKYNINIGEGKDIYIGDRNYISWNEKSIQALIQAIRNPHNTEKTEAYLQTEIPCRDRKTLEQYFKTTLAKLKQKGCLDIRQNVTHKSIQCNYIAKIKDFEAGFGMRGEAFFLFSEFTDLKMPTLQQFSAQAMVWARKSVSPDAAGQSFFNFRVPTHLCFAIAIVDELDPETRTAIQTTNPFDLRVDMLWYEIPVVYELSQQKLYFYDQPTNFLEQFKGEIVWKHLRLIIQQILGVPYK
jgi:hypothetical protein